MQQRGNASQQALLAGLDLLLASDLADRLTQIGPPLHWAFGARDTLVPVSLSATLASGYRQSHITVYEKTAHAPFLTDSDRFMDQLVSVLQQSA
jgi:pimeloyl-[acyl-carrier protein] methyl ester esterase